MVARIVAGRRLNGTYGVWVSRPGYDADTATDDQCLLSVTKFTEQLIMIGTAPVLPVYVPFGFSNAPFVFLTSANVTISMAQSGTPEYGNYSSVSGTFLRPYPAIRSESARVAASVSAAGMNVYTPGGAASVAHYAVYRRALA